MRLTRERAIEALIAVACLGLLVTIAVKNAPEPDPAPKTVQAGALTNQHVSGFVEVPVDRSTFSIAAEITGWPTAPYRCREVTLVNLSSLVGGDNDACEARWNPGSGTTGANLLLPQPTHPFAASSKLDLMPYVTDVVVNTEEANGNAACALWVRCAVERQ